jgi:lysyl-tRNA synthetase, class II
MAARGSALIPGGRADPAAGRADPPARRGRGRARRAWPAPRLAAALAALAGLLNLVSALLPAEAGRLRVLDQIVPGAVSADATAATAAAGIGLLLLAGGLRRRQRLAWLATVGLLAGSAVLNVAKGLDVEEALVEAFLAGLLGGQAGRFAARQGPLQRRAALRPALLVVVATAVYSTLGLLANADDVAGPLTVSRVAGETARMAAGLGSGIGLEGRFGRVFPASVAAGFSLGALLVVARALAPALVRPARDPGLAQAVAASGDSLAYFALRDDRLSVRGGDALVSWAPVGVVALAAGDPLGPPAEWPAAAAAFLAQAATQGRTAAVLGCGAAAARTWQAAGLTTIYLGDEAVLDLDRFTLEGRAVRIARQSWHRAQRAGLTATVHRAGQLPPGELATLHAAAAHWRGGSPERGWSMALGRLLDPRDADGFLVIGRDATGRPLGLLHLVPWDGDGASLDTMRRDRDAPTILNDFLVVEAARQLPALGVRRLSLNFSFLRAILVAGSDAGLSLRAARWALQQLSRRFPIQSLYQFNKKFAPAWQPRYLAVQTAEELAPAALACLRAEGLLTPSTWTTHPQ